MPEGKDKKLAAAFDREILAAADIAFAKCQYQANRFRQMVAERGGVQTAKDLIRSSKISEGLTTLWECGCLDLSVEHILQQPPWRTLFTEEELATARKRLEDLDFYKY